jgi:hypothetical protein
MKLSDDHLNIAILMAEQHLSFLKELKLRRKSDKVFSEGMKPPHEAIKIRTIKRTGRICSVTCSCGEKTLYRVPLNDISDFECPRSK